MSQQDEVLAAAAQLVEAFGRGDTEAYFAAFAPEATFVFYPEAEVLGSRAAYRSLWDQWLSEGWSVRGCRSTDQRVQLVGGDAAVFTHAVETDIATADGEETLRERETIVFQRVDGRWVAVHEHLSPRPS